MTPRPSSLECYWVLSGRLLAGEYPAHVDSPDAVSRLDALLDAGVDSFFDLTEPGELEPYVPLLEQRAKSRGRSIHYSRFPIPDFGLPTRANMLALLDSIDSCLAGNGHVYLHCWGGVGRTGTSVGCWLVRHGHTSHDALAQIRSWRSAIPNLRRSLASPETPTQVEFVRRWHEPRTDAE